MPNECKVSYGRSRVGCVAILLFKCALGASVRSVVKLLIKMHDPTENKK
jgi:hypothetical protein